MHETYHHHAAERVKALPHLNTLNLYEKIHRRSQQGPEFALIKSFPTYGSRWMQLSWVHEAAIHKAVFHEPLAESKRDQYLNRWHVYLTKSITLVDESPVTGPVLIAQSTTCLSSINATAVYHWHFLTTKVNMSKSQASHITRLSIAHIRVANLGISSGAGKY